MELPFDLDLVLYGTGPSILREIGLEIVSCTPNEVLARFEVSAPLCRQCPHGAILNGGISILVSESLAGLCSMLSCYEHSDPCGTTVEAHHMRMVKQGEVLEVKVTPLHLGRRNHVIDVVISNQDGKLVSTSRVVNSLLPKD